MLLNLTSFLFMIPAFYFADFKLSFSLCKKMYTLKPKIHKWYKSRIAWFYILIKDLRSKLVIDSIIKNYCSHYTHYFFVFSLILSFVLEVSCKRFKGYFFLSQGSDYHIHDSCYHFRSSGYHLRYSGYHLRYSGYHLRYNGYHLYDSSYAPIIVFIPQLLID